MARAMNDFIWGEKIVTYTDEDRLNLMDIYNQIVEKDKTFSPGDIVVREESNKIFEIKTVGKTGLISFKDGGNGNCSKYRYATKKRKAYRKGFKFLENYLQSKAKNKFYEVYE